MDRQAGLGRSLNDVIESLTPAERDTALARGAELHDITPQLYRLVLDLHDLRDRVARLEATAFDDRRSAEKHNGKKHKKSGAKRNAGQGAKTKKS